MKNSLTCLIIAFSILILLSGCGTTLSEDTTATTQSTDTLWGKGYAVRFNAYTVHSGHPGDEAWFCLTEDGYMVQAPSAPVGVAKLEPSTFDPDTFTALCTDYGYWQDRFNPEYICRNIKSCWKGKGEAESTVDHYYYLLEMQDGMLMIAVSTNYESDTQYICSVQIVEPAGTQQEYFAHWNNYWETIHSKRNPDCYPYWKSLYKKYAQ